MIGALAAIEMITLHMTDGRVVLVNPAQVQQIIHPGREENKLVAPNAQCVIKMTGNYVAVIESCEEVQKLLEGGK